LNIRYSLPLIALITLGVKAEPVINPQITMDTLWEKINCNHLNGDPEVPESLDSLSRDAKDSGNFALAAILSRNALCVRLKKKEAGVTTLLDSAATTIERSLEADQLEIAEEIATAQFPNEASNTFPGTNKSTLRLSMARARVLSHRDRISDSLAVRMSLQTSLDKEFGANANESLTNRMRSANLLIELGNTDDGIRELGTLIEISKMASPIDEELRLTINESYALAIALVGNEVEAIRQLRQMEHDLSAKLGDDDYRVLKIREDIASILVRQGAFDEALEMESRIFLWKDAHLPENHPQLLKALWRLSYLYVVDRRLETARSALQHIMKQLDENPNLFGRQFYLQNLSRLAILEARDSSAETAASIWKRVYEEELQILGASASDTQVEGTNYAIALQGLGKVRQACDLLKEISGRQSHLRPFEVWASQFTRLSYNRCLLDLGALNLQDDARRSIQESWIEISNHSGESSHNALLALSTYAYAVTLIGDRAKAKELLKLLVRLLEQRFANSSHVKERRNFDLPTWIEGRTVGGDEVPGYRDLALLYAQDGELESALRVSELARDRGLRDLFAEQEWRRTKLPASDRALLDASIDRVQELDERIAVAVDIVERVRLESERTLAVAQRGRLESEIRGRLHLEAPSTAPPTLDALRARLHADTVLVSVLHSGDVWWALVINRDDPARLIEFRDADLGKAASAWVRRLRGDPVRVWPLAQGRLIISDLRPTDAVGPYLNPEELGARLGNSLLGPLVPALGHARHIVFVGDDELVGFPLHALPLGTGVVLDRFDVSYAPSLSTFARWQGPGARGSYAQDLLAIGDINVPADVGASNDPVVVAVQIAAQHPLAFAREEIESISRLFPAGRARTWSGPSANKQSLRRASRAGQLEGFRYVHFATHAWAQLDQPESSAIVLGGKDSDTPAQRALTAAELAGLHMHSELIVLSACDTGQGQFEHGRGLLGLAYAGLAAGNRAAVLSLWPIADDTTAHFMARFYSRLRGGSEPVRALAATQREFHRSPDGRLAAVSTWAPFVLYGGY